LKNILVIEDEQSIADAVVHSIEREGFSATWCSLGNVGLEKLKSGNYALIVLDVGLPDVSGFELCKQIRSFSNIPIIFLTARSEEIDKIVGLEIGGDDYISKPFSPRELGARIKTVLKRFNSSDINNSQSPSPQLSQKNLMIDHEKMVVIYHGKKLELTRYEFKLIALLAKNPGRVYTREMLLENVWDDANSSIDRTVDAHIKSLRSKFKGIVDTVDPINTHRGTGYSLREDL
jgi:two-component system catabolic regulation response regulator CreB